MIRIEFVNDRIARMQSSLTRLEQLGALSLDEFMSSPDNFAIAEHHLRWTLECLLDIGRHILAKGGLGKPENYTEIIVELGASKVISAEFAVRIRGMAGYRNRLVHGYSEITPEEIHSLLTSRLGDFHEYIKQIQAYMDETS